jgi:hypothetical protein
VHVSPGLAHGGIPQVEPLQNGWAPPHAFPQAPQFWMSLATFT